jgi:hypothetical protein
MVCANPYLKRQGNSMGTAWYVFKTVGERHGNSMVCVNRPLVFYSMGTRNPFLEIDCPDYEADHSPASSAKVRKSGTILPLPICFSASTGKVLQFTLDKVQQLCCSCSV